MRTWVKWTIGGVLVALVAFSALAGLGGYYFFRHLDAGSASEADTLKQFDVIRARFGTRPPLLEIINPQAADIRINRLEDPERRRVSTLHILTWSADDDERLQANVPLWLMRFSSVNVLSRLGIAPSKFRLTVQDVERYGPGIVLDVRQPGRSHALVWVE